MNGLNKATLIGNLGRDPEIFTFENGKKKARLTIATTETYKNRQGDKAEHTEWHTVTLFGGLAEVAEKYLKKGNPVYIEGRIRTRSWEDGGKKHYATEIEAREMMMLGGAKKNESPAVIKGQEVAPQVPAKLETEPDYNPEEDEFPF